jgi:hypothetical protein
MGAKKPQTFAKLQRERRVKEKRQLKLEKKQAAAARKLEALNGEEPNSEELNGEEPTGEEPSAVVPPQGD